MFDWLYCVSSNKLFSNSVFPLIDENKLLRWMECILFVYYIALYIVCNCQAFVDLSKECNLR